MPNLLSVNCIRWQRMRVLAGQRNRLRDHGSMVASQYLLGSLGRRVSTRAHSKKLPWAVNESLVPEELINSINSLEGKIANQPDQQIQKHHLPLVKNITKLIQKHSHILLAPRHSKQYSVSMNPGLFNRTVLYDGQDLHVRAHIALNTVDGEAHTHGQHFIASVIQGSYTQEVWQTDGSRPGIYYETTRLPGGKFSLPVEKTGAFESRLSHEHAAGQCYWIHAALLHKVVISDARTLPVSLVFRGTKKLCADAQFVDLVRDREKAGKIQKVSRAMRESIVSQLLAALASSSSNDFIRAHQFWKGEDDKAGVFMEINDTRSIPKANLVHSEMRSARSRFRTDTLQGRSWFPLKAFHLM